MSATDSVISALHDGNDHLVELVSGLSDEDLARQSAATEWDVSEVLSHLGSGAVITLAGLRAALDDAPRPGGDANKAVWDRWNAMSRRERADELLEANQALVDLYDSLDADTRENLRIDLGFLPEPVDLATAARMRLNEFAMHVWDVAVVFDQSSVLPDDAAAALLHGEPNMIGWISKPDQLNGEYAVLEVTTSRPDSRFTLKLNEAVSTELTVPETPDGTLTLPTESWLRLVAGRLSPEHTPTAVVATGAADLGLLRKVFPGY